MSSSKQRISALTLGIKQQRVQRALSSLASCRPPGDEAASESQEAAAKAQIEQARV